MSTLQDQGDEDASASPRKDISSLHDETVVQKVKESCFTFYNEYDLIWRLYSIMKREDLDKVTSVEIHIEDIRLKRFSKLEREDIETVTTVRISRPSTQLENIHLLQALPNLKEVILDHDFNDEDLPALLIGIATLEKVKTLQFRNCGSFTSVSPEIGQLVQLQKLIITGCNRLTSMSSEIGQLINLQTLEISHCQRLTAVPTEIGQLINLQSLIIIDCSLAAVPTEIGQLISLQTLKISDCDSLTSVPPEIGQLINLLHLDIFECSSLTSVPPEIGQLTNLQILDIDTDYYPIPLSPIFLKALPLQCFITIYGEMGKPFKDFCNANGCDISIGYEGVYLKSKTSFKRHEINPYFDWVRNYPIGIFKLQMLANKARQRANTAIFSPGGPKYEQLKISWEEMQEGDN